MHCHRNSDLIYDDGENPLQVYEIKADGSDSLGFKELNGYLSTLGAIAEGAVAGSPELVFGGNAAKTLPGKWFEGTTYTFKPSRSGDGVITYSVNNKDIYQEFFQAFKNRKKGTPLLPLPRLRRVPVL